MPPIGKLLASVVVICITLELLETSPGLSMPIVDNGDNVSNTSSQRSLQHSLSTELNCSGSNVSQNTYAHDFLQLSIGVYVLKQYSSTVYRNRNSEFPTSADCSSPVEYTGIYYSSRIAQIQDVASWFGVFQSFKEYLESLTVIAEDDANVLVNITAVLNRVLSGYRDVVSSCRSGEFKQPY